MPRIARPPVPPPKDCACCGRPFTWRKKWERDWPNVKYCSDACRRKGSPVPADHAPRASHSQTVIVSPGGSIIHRRIDSGVNMASHTTRRGAPNVRVSAIVVSVGVVTRRALGEEEGMVARYLPLKPQPVLTASRGAP